MKIQYFKTLLILLLTWLVVPSLPAQEIPEFKIMTEHWIPYQFEKDGKLQGIAIDLLAEMLIRLGSRQGIEDFKIYPWARGYHQAQTEKNTILFSTTRTEERETLFKWVGPITLNKTCLIAKKDRQIKINTVDDISKYRIGTVIGDVSEQLLLDEGISKKRLDQNTKGSNNIRKLQLNRIDLTPQHFAGFKQGAINLGFNPDNFECVFNLRSNEISYAFHKATPDWLIKRFQKEFDTTKSEGLLKSIYQRYDEPYAE